MYGSPLLDAESTRDEGKDTQSDRVEDDITVSYCADAHSGHCGALNHCASGRSEVKARSSLGGCLYGVDREAVGEIIRDSIRELP